jgi:hypothetical protein
MVRPAAVVVVGTLIYVAVVSGFRLAGHWHTAVSETEYHHRLQEIDRPHYSHPDI